MVQKRCNTCALHLKLIKATLLACLFFVLQPAGAQQCEWLNLIGEKSNGNKLSYSIVTDDSSNILVTGTFNDTLVIGAFTLTNGGSTSVGGNDGVVVKYSSAGNIIWARQSKVDTSVKNSIAIFFDIDYDKAGNYYILGYAYGKVDFGNSVGLNVNKFCTFLLKLDNNGIAQWIRTLHSTGSIEGGKITLDKSTNPIIGLQYRGTLSMSGTSTTLSNSSNTNFAIIKYSGSGAFQWATDYGGSKDETHVDIQTDAANNIYLYGESADDMTFGSQTLKGAGRVVLKTDSSGTPVKGLKILIGMTSPGCGGLVVYPDGRFVITGAFQDSVDFDNGKKVYETGTGFTNSFLTFYNDDMSCRWVLKDDPQPAGLVCYVGSPSISNGFIYSGGIINNGDSKLGASLLTSISSSFSPSAFLLKMDTLANVLWAFSSGSAAYQTIYGTAADKVGDGYITGFWKDTINYFGKGYKAANASLSHGFTAKITDYSITRGFVYPGPYCAGDSFKVPYTVMGKYNAGNQFIAELSDSSGNFDGKERELGRVTDTLAGIIKGALPLFNVATNNKYRIRIISTNPTVQSFYKFDTLRLLVYSKDTANAGSDTAICQGQALRLGTTGGSRWNWSPSTFMPNPMDTSNRQPLTLPTAAIEYRVIISDSSGCGDVDTDYVKVTIRPPVKVQIKGDTTLVCRGFGQYLRAKVTGGNDKSYWYVWKSVGFGVTLSIKDSLFVTPYDTTTYYVIVGDSCSNKTDTAYFTVNVSTYLEVTQSPDTTVCKGKPATLYATGDGCNPNYYRFDWYEKDSAVLLGSGNSFIVTPLATTEYSVVLRDTTTFLSDTAHILVTVDSAFTAVASNDTSVCSGHTAQLSAFAISCDTSQLEYIWDNSLGTGKTKIVSPSTTTVYSVIIKNGFNGLSDTATVKVTIDDAFKVNGGVGTFICIGQSATVTAYAYSCDTSDMEYVWDDGLGIGQTKTVSPTTTTTYIVTGINKFNGLMDTASVTVNVRPPLSVSVNADTTICFGQTAELRAVSLGGDAVNHRVVWMEVGGQTTVNSPQTTVNPTKTTTYRALLTDGCTVLGDSAEITITVRPPLKVTVNADTTICIGQTSELRATLSGGYNPSHSILWTAGSGPWTNTNPNGTVTPNLTTIYKALLSDGCSNPSDSAQITVTVRPPLKVSLNNDTTICTGQSAELRTMLSGGYTPSHSILWTAVVGPWTSTNPKVTVSPTTTTTYKAVFSDNCTTPSDSAQITVTVRPPLQITASAKDSICSNQILLLKSTVSGGNLPSHSIQWTSDNGLLTTDPNSTDTPKINTTYIVRLSDNCSPDVFDTLTVIVLPVPKADFGVLPFEGCPPLSVNFTDLSTGNDTSLNKWKIQSSEVLGVKEYSHVFTQSGKYGAGLTASNALGCIDYIYKPNIVTVFDKPDAMFIAKPDIKEIESPVFLYNQSRRANSYTWDMGDGHLFTQNNTYDTLYSYTDTGAMVIKLIAQNEKGCLDTQEQIIQIFDKMNCVIPTAFTPNGDGINNTFAPVCVGVATYHFTLFNRWGQAILDCDDCRWDGTFGGYPVPPGVYMYKLKLKAHSNKEGTSFGTVQVVR